MAFKEAQKLITERDKQTVPKQTVPRAERTNALHSENLNSNTYAAKVASNDKLSPQVTALIFMNRLQSILLNKLTAILVDKKSVLAQTSIKFSWP
jgi:hypothetical protein